MNLLPFWKTIIWKSWANRAIALSLGCFAGFAGISATPVDVLAYVPDMLISGTKYALATSGFIFGIAATLLRVVVQNFGVDAVGNQIVTAVGTAPPGTNPNPAVVVSAAEPK